MTQATPELPHAGAPATTASGAAHPTAGGAGPPTAASAAPAPAAGGSPSTLKVGEQSYAVLQADPNDPESPTLYMEMEALQLTVNFLRHGEPVVFLGEAGSGKTELARAISRRMKTDEFFQCEFGGVISGDQLDGHWALINGETVHFPSEHLKAVRAAAEGRRVFYLPDEMNRASMFGINKLLRLYGQWEYVTDTDGVLHVDPYNLLTIGTMNVGFGFSGTNAVDDAIADRFAPIRLEAPPAELMSRILHDRFDSHGIDAHTVRGVCKLYEASRADENSYSLGVRDALKVAKGVCVGKIALISSVEKLIGGAAFLRNLPEESTEALITLAKSL